MLPSPLVRRQSDKCQPPLVAPYPLAVASLSTAVAQQRSASLNVVPKEPFVEGISSCETIWWRWGQRTTCTREDQCFSQSAYTNRIASLHVTIL